MSTRRPTKRVHPSSFIFHPVFPFILLLPLFIACASSSSYLITAESRVPIGEEISAASAQRRVVPWSEVTLRATATYRILRVSEVPTDTEADADAPVPATSAPLLSPGLQAGKARLEARETALLDLARQLTRLPASEPPPGETNDSNVLDFARRQPSFDEQVQLSLRSASETVRPVNNGQAILQLELPLKPLAQVLLDQGGGFLPDNQKVAEIGPRGRAQRQARREAEEKLVEAVLAREIRNGVTVGQWVEADPTNRELLRVSITSMRVLASEAVPAESGGGEDFQVSLEYDIRELMKTIRTQEERLRSMKPIATPQ